MTAIVLALASVAVALVIRWAVVTEKTSRDDSFGGIFALKKHDERDE